MKDIIRERWATMRMRICQRCREPYRTGRFQHLCDDCAYRVAEAR